jgi:hypothetical protein
MAITDTLTLTEMTQPLSVVSSSKIYSNRGSTNMHNNRNHVSCTKQRHSPETLTDTFINNSTMTIEFQMPISLNYAILLYLSRLRQYHCKTWITRPISNNSIKALHRAILYTLNCHVAPLKVPTWNMMTSSQNHKTHPVSAYTFDYNYSQFDRHNLSSWQVLQKHMGNIMQALSKLRRAFITPFRRVEGAVLYHFTKTRVHQGNIVMEKSPKLHH